MSRIVPDKAMDSVYTMLATMTPEQVEKWRDEILLKITHHGGALWWHLDYQANHHLWQLGKISTKEFAERTECSIKAVRGNP